MPSARKKQYFARKINNYQLTNIDRDPIMRLNLRLISTMKEVMFYELQILFHPAAHRPGDIPKAAGQYAGEDHPLRQAPAGGEWDGDGLRGAFVPHAPDGKGDG